MNIVKTCFSVVFLAGLFFVFSSCIDSDVQDPNVQLQADITAIDSYLSAHSIVALKDPYGLRMDIEELGTGLPASFGTTVKVKYTGTLLSTGATFDHSDSYTVAPNASTGQWDVITGWKIALTTLPEGSKAKIYIPSGYAYGTSANGPVPANSILVFEIEILQVIRTTAYFNKIKTDSTAIDSYLTTKGIYDDAVKDSTGIRYIITAQGTGISPSWYDKLKFKYTLKLLSDDASVIETGTLEPSDTFYSRVVDYVDGLKIGFQKINKNTKATFYIPSGYAYGGQASDKIPANSILIFEIELLDINP